MKLFVDNLSSFSLSSFFARRPDRFHCHVDEYGNRYVCEDASCPARAYELPFR